MQSRILNLDDLIGNDPDREVISVLRFFTSLRFGVGLIAAVLSYWLNDQRQIELSNLLGLAETALLLLYLAFPRLQRRLGKSYLPVALVTTTLGPMVENTFLLQGVLFTVGQAAASASLSDELTRQAIFAGQFQLSILLLVPLILVSWRYSYRSTVIYILGITAADVLIPVALLNFGVIAGAWRIMVGVLFRTLVYLLFGYLISRLVSGQKRQNAELAAANQRLADYATTLEQLAISHERNRLAREFHDTLAHTLSAVAVQLEAVSALQKSNPERASAMLAHSLALTRDGLNETRRAIQALRAAPLEDLGLRGALESLAHSSAERFGWELHLDLATEWNGLSDEVEHAIYRIVEEALRNAGNHAQARRVDLAVRRVDGQLELDMRDDGEGFRYDPEGLEDHYGLRGMMERARSIGATLAIDSQPGQGAHLQLVFRERA